jgi:hypothetical protein
LLVNIKPDIALRSAAYIGRFYVKGICGICFITVYKQFNIPYFRFMKKPFIPAIVNFLFGIILVTSCGSRKHVDKSDQIIIKAAVDSVIHKYGAIRHKWEIFKGTDDNPETIFKLEIDGSPVVKEYAGDPGDVASGMAYSFYARLDNLKKEYTIIRIMLHDDKGIDQYDFSQDRLHEVERYEPLLNQTLAEVDANQYQALYEKVEKNDTNLILISTNDIQNLCHRTDSLIGDFRKTWIFCFRYEPYPQKDTRFLILTASVKGTKQTAFFSIMLNPVTGKIVAMQPS